MSRPLEVLTMVSMVRRGNVDDDDIDMSMVSRKGDSWEEHYSWCGPDQSIGSFGFHELEGGEELPAPAADPI